MSRDSQALSNEPNQLNRSIRLAQTDLDLEQIMQIEIASFPPSDNDIVSASETALVVRSDRF